MAEQPEVPQGGLGYVGGTCQLSIVIPSSRMRALMAAVVVKGLVTRRLSYGR